MNRRAIETISAADARRSFMHAQGLLDDPARPGAAASASLAKLIERMGFVQIDTINVVERAHHLILATRVDGYSHAALDALQCKHKKLFEHWTHDASFIPTKWFAQWKPRFERYRTSRWHARQIGDNADALVEMVRDRIRREGPLMSRDFEHAGERSLYAWWGWKPQKVALDYLWRIGELYVVGRVNFQKVYDLTERALPEHHAAPAPTDEEHLEWACRSAIERLGGIATLREVSQFWHSVKVDRVRRWVDAALARGELIEVLVESTDGSAPQRAVVTAGFRRRLRDAKEALDDSNPRTRLICPFDPILRDRARAKRLFDFDYRFEGFVPAKQRKHGYYVMPLMEKDRFVGRIDPKFDRQKGKLVIRSLRWEPGVKADKKRLARLDEALRRLATTIGADGVALPRSARRL